MGSGEPFADDSGNDGQVAIEVEGSLKYPLGTHIADYVDLKVVDCTQKSRPEFRFRMHYQCPMRELMKAYCKRTKQQVGTVRFIIQNSEEYTYSQYDLFVSPCALDLMGGETIHAIPFRDEENAKLPPAFLWGSMLELVRGERDPRRNVIAARKEPVTSIERPVTSIERPVTGSEEPGAGGSGNDGQVVITVEPPECPFDTDENNTANYIHLRVIDCTQRTRPEFWFRMHKWCETGNLMTAYYKQTNHMDEIRFIFGGGRYSVYDARFSPCDLDMKDGDTIHVIPFRDEEEDDQPLLYLSGSMLDLVRG